MQFVFLLLETWDKKVGGLFLALHTLYNCFPSSDWQFERTFLRTSTFGLNPWADCRACTCLLHHPVPKSQTLKFSPT